MNPRRPDRIGVEKVNYDSHLARVKQAKTSVDCHAPKSHPLLNRVDVDQVNEASIGFVIRILHQHHRNLIHSRFLSPATQIRINRVRQQDTTGAYCNNHSVQAVC